MPGVGGGGPGLYTLDDRDCCDGENADCLKSADPIGLEMGWPRTVMGDGLTLDEFEDPSFAVVDESIDKAEFLALLGVESFPSNCCSSVSIDIPIGGADIGS